MSLSESLIGIDLGGTKIALARFDAQTMERQAYEIYPTHAELSFSGVCQEMLKHIDAIRAPDTVAIGIGVPGLVDKKTNRVLSMPNIPGSQNADPAGAIAAHTGLPVIIENDASCFTYAEAMEGAGKGKEVVVGVTLGTGVGGGIVIDGKIYRGAHGFASELGHMLLMPGKVPYPDPQGGSSTRGNENKQGSGHSARGDVEQYLSGTALGKRCVSAKNPGEYLQGEACSMIHPDIFREVAWFVTSLTHILDPSVIVFGGSAGRALMPHLPAIGEELKHWLLPTTPVPQLTISVLADAAVRGAALLGRTIVEVKGK